MRFSITRRAAIAGGGMLLAASVVPATAQDKPTLRFSAVFSEQDIRAEMMKRFAEAIADDFTF
jgi:TRAP-type transport system periplasmic protein